jgi:hypothetical protein
MSLTLTDTVMVAVHETGVNDFLAAFFNARRRHLVYGTPAFIPTTTVSAISISAMTFPGIPGGIDILVVFSPPTVDFDPDSSGRNVTAATWTRTIGHPYQCGAHGCLQESA